MPEPKGNLVTLVAIDDTGKLHVVLVDADGILQATID